MLRRFTNISHSCSLKVKPHSPPCGEIHSQTSVAFLPHRPLRFRWGEAFLPLMFFLPWVLLIGPTAVRCSFSISHLLSPTQCVVLNLPSTSLGNEPSPGRAAEEQEPWGRENTSLYTRTCEARIYTQRSMSRLIPRPLPSLALTTNSLWVRWDLFREHTFMISQHILGRPIASWIFPLHF